MEESKVKARERDESKCGKEKTENKTRQGYAVNLVQELKKIEK